MADYRAYTVGYDGHFSDCEARTCDEDRDAIEGAKQLAASFIRQSAFGSGGSEHGPASLVLEEL